MRHQHALVRPRWLVLFRDSRSRLPVLCSFKRPRSEWNTAAAGPPKATERIVLVGAACMAMRGHVRGKDHTF